MSCERTRAVESISNKTNFATTLISTDSVHTDGVLGALISIFIDTFIDILKTKRMQSFVKDTTLQNKYTADFQKGILGAFNLAKRFGWEFRKTFCVNSHSFQTWNLIDRSKNVPDGAMMVQEDNMVETEKWSTSEGRPFVTGNFRLVFTFCLHFNHSTENCAIWKAPLSFIQVIVLIKFTWSSNVLLRSSGL